MGETPQIDHIIVPIGALHAGYLGQHASVVTSNEQNRVAGALRGFTIEDSGTADIVGSVRIGDFTIELGGRTSISFPELKEQPAVPFTSLPRN